MIDEKTKAFVALILFMRSKQTVEKYRVKAFNVILYWHQMSIMKNTIPINFLSFI